MRREAARWRTPRTAAPPNSSELRLQRSRLLLLLGYIHCTRLGLLLLSVVQSLGLLLRGI